MKTTSEILKRAKDAALSCAPLDTNSKNAALLNMAQSLINHTDDILAANKTANATIKNKAPITLFFIIFTISYS